MIFSRITYIIIFETDPGRLSFSTTLLIHPDFADKNVGVNVGVKLNVTQKKIIEILINYPDYTIDENADALGVHSRTLERNLKILKENGFVKRIGSDKNGKWVVKKEGK